MLAAQHKEFEEKKKDESPYPRDFTRWYFLDYFRRPRKLKSVRFYVTLGTALAVAVICLATMVPAWHRVHQAAPLAQAHALLNDNCAACHDQAFTPAARLLGAHVVSVSDAACNHCHQGASHHAKQDQEAACASCHREHQGHELLAWHVADRNCTQCHADLAQHIKPGETTSFHVAITDFNRDHPEFQWTRKGTKDPSKIRFNHKAHLELNLADLLKRPERKLDGMALGAKLECGNCHVLDAARRYFVPISYENHCGRCHQLNVAIAGAMALELKEVARKFSETPLPHKEPAIVRAVLRERLIKFAQENDVTLGKAEPSKAPRPLPWKVGQPISDEQWLWVKKQGEKAETLLFMNKQWSKADPLTSCGHCHIEKKARDGLPEYEPTAIPTRWFAHARFDHGSHRATSCDACHDHNAGALRVTASETAADILLPTLSSCRDCHRPQGAPNRCVTCHDYHERSPHASRAEGHGTRGVPATLEK